MKRPRYLNIKVLAERSQIHQRFQRTAAQPTQQRGKQVDGIKNQVEGAIIQAASWTLYEELAFDHTRIKSRDWATYPILRFQDVFRSIDVEVIDRGTGEGGQGPTAAAIANALANATGQRIRELPFTRDRVKTALLQRQ
jgi:nicotinate dehydrogenase subunit B